MAVCSKKAIAKQSHQQRIVVYQCISWQLRAIQSHSFTYLPICWLMFLHLAADISNINPTVKVDVFSHLLRQTSWGISLLKSFHPYKKLLIFQGLWTSDLNRVLVLSACFLRKTYSCCLWVKYQWNPYNSCTSTSNPHHQVKYLTRWCPAIITGWWFGCHQFWIFPLI